MPIYDITNNDIATKITQLYDVDSNNLATKIKEVYDISYAGTGSLVYVSTQPLWLYNRGTMGAIGNFTNIGGVAGSTTTSSSRLHVGANADTYGNRAGGATVAVDLTPYKTLRVVATSSGAGTGSNSAKIGFATKRTQDDNLFVPSKGWTINPGSSEKTFTWDISGHTGMYYFHVRVYNWSSTAVWLRVHEAELLP